MARTKSENSNTLTLKKGGKNNPSKGGTQTLADAAGASATGLLDAGDDGNDEGGNTEHANDRQARASALASNPDIGAMRGEERIDQPVEYDVGENVFDVIDGSLGTKEQNIAWRAIYHSSLATAFYIASFVIGLLERDGEEVELTDPRVLEGKYKISLLSDLARYAEQQALALSDSEYDKPMAPTALFDLMVNGEPQPQEQNTAAHEALMNAMDLSEEEKALARANRLKLLRQQDLKKQETMKSRRAQILDDVLANSDARFLPDRFDARQHLRFYQKVHQKLRDAAKKALAFVGRYDDAEVDALSFTQAARRVDKCMAAFRRKNAQDLVQHEALSND